MAAAGIIADMWCCKGAKQWGLSVCEGIIRVMVSKDGSALRESENDGESVCHEQKWRTMVQLVNGQK